MTMSEDLTPEQANAITAAENRVYAALGVDVPLPTPKQKVREVLAELVLLPDEQPDAISQALVETTDDDIEAEADRIAHEVATELAPESDHLRHSLAHAAAHLGILRFMEHDKAPTE